MKNINILVVDDSKTFNTIMTNLLKEFGYSVIQAYTLKDAKKILETKNIDYIMLDLNLPDGNGEELIVDIRANSTSKIIVMTGDEDTGHRDKMFKKGIIDYFIKTSPAQIIVNCTHTVIETLEKHKNTNILTIDDSMFVRTMLKHILESKGYNVFEASNAIDGKKILEKNDIHLVLLDLIMPGIDGMKFLEDIKTNTKLYDIPVIVISGDQSRESYARVLKQGASDFIKKPFIVEEVLLKCDIHVKSYISKIENKQQQEMIKSQKNKIEKHNIYNRNLIESSMDSLVTISKDGKITDINKSTIKTTGIQRDKLIGSDFTEYFTEPQKAQKVYEIVLRDGKIIDYPLKLKNKNGDIIDVLYNATTYTNIDGDIEGVFAAARDITEVIKLKEKVLEAKKLRSMTDLIKNIGHHWRQPLSIISTSASGVKLEQEFGIGTKEKCMESMDSIVEYSEYLSKTIDDFQILFNQDIKKQKVNIGKLCEDILLLNSNFFEKNNIKIIKNIDNINIDIYKNELEQVLRNLIGNIKEHSKSNQFIFIDISLIQNITTIKIKDSGGGISEDILNYIFEPYFTTEHQSMGKGMGLYIVYKIIKEHFKGDIKIQNSTYKYEDKFYTGVDVIIEIPN